MINNMKTYMINGKEYLGMTVTFFNTRTRDSWEHIIVVKNKDGAKETINTIYNICFEERYVMKFLEINQINKSECELNMVLYNNNSLRDIGFIFHDSNFNND